jgi:DNA polymerase-4
MHAMSRSILHIDMDAFFASVEVRERPELAGRPVIVGGSAEGRGVVSAASYEARRFGVHSAMPTAVARRLCPHGVYLPTRHGFYAEVARDIRAIFERYTPLVEPLSLDEAFLDVTGSERLFGDAASIGRRIKEEIRAELHLVASVGVAPNKFLAKIGSDLDKPNGFVVVEPDGIEAFLDPLPVERIWGVGPVTAKVFRRLGIRTIGQLRGYSRQLLDEHFGLRTAEHLWRLARGLDERPVVAEQEAKSVSHETTFGQDIDDRQVLRAWLLDLTEQVTARLRRAGLQGRTVQIKVRYGDFTTVTRSRSLSEPTDSTARVWELVQHLFDTQLPAHRPVRLVGVGVSGFEASAGTQADLLGGDRHDRSRRVDEVVDSIRDRFGSGALHRAGTARRR